MSPIMRTSAKMSDLETELLVASTPFPHERRAAAFEVYQIRADYERLAPTVNHVTDEGAPYWEVWFMHAGRPVIFRYSGDQLNVQEFSELLHRAVVSRNGGDETDWVVEADLFAKRIREMLYGEQWVALRMLPTR